MRNPGLDGPPSLRYMITSRVILAVLLTTALVGIFYASGNLEYTWRWNRVPQYFWAQGELETRVEHDAVVSDITQDATGITVLLTPQDAGVHPEEIRLPIDAKILADKGQDVYHGDTLARHPYSKPGILLEGLWVTIKVSVLAIMVGIFLGLGAGLCRISRDPALRWGAITYIEIIRGSPLLVQIFLWYFVVGYLVDGLLKGVVIPAMPPLWTEPITPYIAPIWYGVMALAIFTGAYVAEIVRAGIQSVSRGQMEAARSLGMTHTQAMRKIILPQAFRRILPPLAGQFISLVKDSSLLGVMAVRELTKATREAVTSSMQSLELWFTCALLYLVLTFTLSLFVQYLERRAIRR